MLTRTSAIPHRQATCPYCATPIDHWPQGSHVQTCRSCRRPMVLIRSPFDRQGPKRLRGFIELGLNLYGVATLLLVLVFALTAMPPRNFVQLFALLLSFLAIVLGTDAILGLITAIDCTARRVRIAGRARTLAGLKLAGAASALAMVVIGIRL